MSDDVQRHIKKLNPAGPRSFDEQTWPIYVALVVLGGYIAGVILSALRLDDPRWYANAITWISFITVAIVAGIWAVSRLQHTALRRTLIFSLLLSLIVNLSFLVLMALTSIFSPFWREENPKAITEREEEQVVIPEYPLFNPEQEQRVRQDHERPVETGEPEADAMVELNRQSTESQPTPQQDAMPTPQEHVDANSLTKPQRVQTPSAPRRSESLAKLSRQDLSAELNVSTRPDALSQPRPPRPAPLTETVASQATPAKQQLRQDAPEMPTERDEAPRRVTRTELARQRDTQVEQAQVASLPLLARQLDRPRALPRSATPVEVESTIARRSETALEPHSTLTRKQATSAPEQSTTVDLQATVAHQLDRARPRVDQPRTDSMSEAVARATLTQTSRSATAVDAPSPTQTPSESQALDSSAAQVARQQLRANPVASRLPVPSPAPATAQSAQAVARATSNETPSLAKANAPTQSMARASRMADRMASTNTEVANAVQSSAQSDSPLPATEPSRMALSRSAVGVAGVGNAANLERGVAAPDSPVQVASASANRARATQTDDPGPALAPSARSVNRQLRANLDSPRNSLQAQEIETAMVPGAPDPASQASSSPATLEQARSDAADAATTAAKGATEVDLGPTRLAADTGSGRAEGGGQPEISGGELPRALSRDNSIAGQAAIQASTQAAEVAAPAARTVASQASQAVASGSEVARSTAAVPTAGGAVQGQAVTNPESGEIRIASSVASRATDQSTAGTPSLATGGNTTPGRSARSLQIRSRTESSVPSLASATASTGSNRGVPLDAQGAELVRASGGLLVERSERVGAAAGDLDVEGTAQSRVPTPSFSPRTQATGDEGADVVADRRSQGAPRRRARATIAGSTDVELDPEEFAVNVPATGRAEDALDGTDGSSALEHSNKLSGGALAVDVVAPQGDGGLGTVPAVDAGIFSRQAQADSELVSLQPARFMRRATPSAALSARTGVATPTEAFRRRVVRRGEELAGERGLPSPKTEESIELGLVFLARYQSADGSWSLNNFADGKARLPDGEEAIMVSDSAATGLSLLSFLGAGYHHRDDKYQEVVKNGLDFLLQHQQDNGDLYIDQDPNSSRSAWMYSHGIAAIALCEAYGMTQDPELLEPAQDAIDFIVDAQHPTRGGWRYSPAFGSDTSVSGWMAMALKSGELAGLDVPEVAYERLRHWLDLAQDSDARPYVFRYNPYAPDTAQQRHGREATRAMTAVGLLARLYTGWRRDDPNMLLGAHTLSQNLPELGTTSRPRRDTYYWYYATQVMYHMGGDEWETWNQKLHPMLTDTQVKTGDLAGSWNPLSPIPDRWGAHGGRLYVTNLNLLSLEVFYRHLPIYEETSK